MKITPKIPIGLLWSSRKHRRKVALKSNWSPTKLSYDTHIPQPSVLGFDWIMTLSTILKYFLSVSFINFASKAWSICWANVNWYLKIFWALHLQCSWQSVFWKRNVSLYSSGYEISLIKPSNENFWMIDLYSLHQFWPERICLKAVGAESKYNYRERIFFGGRREGHLEPYCLWKETSMEALVTKIPKRLGTHPPISFLW